MLCNLRLEQSESKGWTIIHNGNFILTHILYITRKMVPIKGRAKVKLFDVHALCRFDDVHVRRESFS